MTQAIAALLRDISDSALAAELSKRGWSCQRKSDFPWETQAQFNARHRRNEGWLSKKLNRMDGVPHFEAQRGKSGRIVRLRSNAGLEEFAANGKH
jgi:hypothetical protein